jgi:hypothetical protein
VTPREKKDTFRYCSFIEQVAVQLDVHNLNILYEIILKFKFNNNLKVTNHEYKRIRTLLHQEIKSQH